MADTFVKRPIYANAKLRTKTPLEVHFYIQATRAFTAFVRHAAESLFYFPQNAVYRVIFTFSV